MHVIKFIKIFVSSVTKVSQGETFVFLFRHAKAIIMSSFYDNISFIPGGHVHINLTKSVDRKKAQTCCNSLTNIIT
jgi:hypothetical protein